MALGVSLYAFPDIAALFWPYPVKVIAARMFASMFISVGAVALLALRDRSGGSDKASLFSIVPIYLMVGLAAFLASTFQLALSAVVLLGYLLATGGVGLLLLGWGRFDGSSTGKMQRGTKIAFALHAGIVVFFGLNMFLLPSLAMNFWPWRVSISVMQGLGALFLGTAVGTGWASRQKDLARVKALFIPYILFVGLVLLGVILNWGTILGESPGVDVTAFWILVYLYVGAYCSYYLVRTRRPT